MNYGDNIKETNPVAYRIIKNSIEHNKLSHAYLFSATKSVTIGNEPLFLIRIRCTGMTGLGYWKRI